LRTGGRGMLAPAAGVCRRSAVPGALAAWREAPVAADTRFPVRLRRGYAKYAFFQTILDAGSSFVGRVDDNAVVEIIEERPLSAQARAAGVVRDAVVWLGCMVRRGGLRTPVRLIEVACKPHRRPSGKGVPGTGQGCSVRRSDLRSD